MTNQVQVFNHQEFGKLEMLLIDGKPYFPASDCAKILGYSDAINAIKQHCRWVVKHHIGVQTGVKADGSPAMQTVEKNFIPEGDLYRLIARSKLPSAVAFESWVFDEVLPSIRQTGGYGQTFQIPQTFSEALLLAASQAKEIEVQNKQLEELKPKAEFFDAVADCKDAIDIGSVAKVLNIDGIGRNRLFEVLRNKGVLMQNNQPYQKYIDCGYFRTIEQKFTKPSGDTCIYIKTVVYQKGLDYINKLCRRSTGLVVTARGWAT